MNSADAWAVVLDAGGKIAWGRGDVGGDPLLVVLTEAVSDSQIAGLRADGVSYIVAGEREIDLVAALEALNRELGMAAYRWRAAVRSTALCSRLDRSMKSQLGGWLFIGHVRSWRR